MSSLPPLVDVTATRQTLHAVAERIAQEQYAAIATIRLSVTELGFATRWFTEGAEEVRLRAERHRLIRETESGGEESVIDGLYDPAAAGVLYAWWSLGWRVLHTLEARTDELSPVVLWPEHFDVAVTLTTPDQRSMNLGFSPGDDFCPEPYVYAGPWDQQDGSFWNAPFGAYRSYSEIAAGDPATAAAGFLEEARAVFAE